MVYPLFISKPFCVCMVMGCLFVAGCNSLSSDETDLRLNDQTKFLQEEEQPVVDYSNQLLNSMEYKNWVISHCLQKHEFGDMYYKLLYKPHDYILCLESPDSEITEEKEKEMNAELGSIEYFDLRIGKLSDSGDLLQYKLEDSNGYEERVKYFAFRFQNSIHLISNNKDTISPALFHFERYNDLAPYCNFSIGFSNERIDYSGPVQIIVTDSIFGYSSLTFNFSGKQLQLLPKLKTI